MSSPQHHGSSVTAGMPRARTDTPFACPVSLDSEEPGTDSATGEGPNLSDNPAFLPRESKKPAPSEFLGLAGAHTGCRVLPRETALARKFKHPKGLRCHHTFRIGALESQL